MRSPKPPATHSPAGNIIQFPKQGAKPPSPASAQPSVSPVDPGDAASARPPRSRRPSGTMDRTTSDRRRRQTTRVLTAEERARDQEKVRIMGLKRPPDSPELADAVAVWTARQVLRQATSGKAPRVKLRRLVKENLDLMCRFKHPVGLILRDWLDGNRRFLPANFPTLVEYSSCVEESK
ncbi:conserved hypothetical protein [Hoeflea sp. EC-HK425]|nr:conserved hypothetical protein [Hoeflea sp. EC-HK425]